MNTLKTKSFLGVVVAIIGFVLQPSVLAILPEKVAAIVMAVGGVLAAFGFRSAIEKSGPVA